MEIKAEPGILPRQEPTLEAQLWELEELIRTGAPVRVVEQVDGDDGPWAHVQFDGQEGWVRTRYLQKPSHAGAGKKWNAIENNALNMGKGNEAALLKQEADDRKIRYQQFLNRDDETYSYSEAADAILKYLMGPKQPGDQARDDARQKEFKDDVDKLTAGQVKVVAWVFRGGRSAGGQADDMLRAKIRGDKPWVQPGRGYKQRMAAAGRLAQLGRAPARKKQKAK
jgi:hypothetical protein